MSLAPGTQGEQTHWQCSGGTALQRKAHRGTLTLRTEPVGERPVWPLRASIVITPSPKANAGYVVGSLLVPLAPNPGCQTLLSAGFVQRALQSASASVASLFCGKRLSTFAHTGSITVSPSRSSEGGLSAGPLPAAAG